MLVSIFLVTLPIISNPIGALTAIAITLSAVPVYYFFIGWERKPKWIPSSDSKYFLLLLKKSYNCQDLVNLFDVKGKCTEICQKIFLAVPDTTDEKED